MTKVRWKPAIGYPGIMVSDTGVVRGSQHPSRMFQWPGPTRKHAYRKNQSPAVRLVNESGVSKCAGVHRLVYETFHGPLTQPNQQIRHKDGDYRNCALSNLYLTTRSETNSAPKSVVGNVGEDCTFSVLRELDVITIRRLYRPRVRRPQQRGYVRSNIEELASKFAVTTQTIYDIVKCRTWRYLGKMPEKSYNSESEAPPLQTLTACEEGS